MDGDRSYPVLDVIKTTNTNHKSDSSLNSDELDDN